MSIVVYERVNGLVFDLYHRGPVGPILFAMIERSRLSAQEKQEGFENQHGQDGRERDRSKPGNDNTVDNIKI